MYRLFVTIITLSLLFTSCSRSKLSVRSDYFGKKDLSSVVVDTPDPEKDTYFGQRLFIVWMLTSSDFAKGNSSLDVAIRLKNGDLKELTFPLTSRWGTKIIKIQGEEYKKTKGLESYLVTIHSGPIILAKSRHKFWIETIKVR